MWRLDRRSLIGIADLPKHGIAATVVGDLYELPRLIEVRVGGWSQVLALHLLVDPVGVIDSGSHHH
jgi:hypothetical protein